MPGWTLKFDSLGRRRSRGPSGGTDRSIGLPVLESAGRRATSRRPAISSRWPASNSPCARASPRLPAQLPHVARSIPLSIPDMPVRRSIIMTNRTTRHLGHRSGPARGNTPALRVGAGRPRAAKFSAAPLPQGVWDRDLDGAAPKVNPIHHLGLHLLEIVARLAFSLFITAGFAAGLCLNASMSLSNPNLVTACGGVFLWTLVLISCVTSRGS